MTKLKCQRPDCDRSFESADTRGRKRYCSASCREAARLAVHERYNASRSTDTGDPAHASGRTPRRRGDLMDQRMALLFEAEKNGTTPPRADTWRENTPLPPEKETR